MSAITTLSARGRHLADLALPNVDEPRTERAARRAAMAWLAEHGVPDRNDEDWRYTDLRGFLQLPLTPAPSHVGEDRGVASAIADATLEFGGARLVFVNGALAVDGADLGPEPGGLHLVQRDAVSSLTARDGDVPWPDGFAALNAALAHRVIEVVVEDARVLDAPIEVLFLGVPSSTGVELASPHLRLVLGAGAAATVVETHLGSGTGPYVTNGVCEIVLGDGARLTHCVLVDEPVDARRLMARRVHLGTASEYRSHLVSLGSRLARDEVHVELGGEQARVILDACYLAGRGHHQDHPIRVEHRAPGGISRQRIRGIVAGDGHGVFNGHVIVRPGAFGTDASQHNANLICSDQAEVDTRPRLEIFADDVACAHGATVGRLDPEALFYLRSRGIDETTARQLLAAAFLDELLAAIPVAAFAERARERVGARLAKWWANPEGEI